MLKTTRRRNRRSEACSDRKQRVVKNGYIDIDNIDQQAGVNYIEWIKLSKQKLMVSTCLEIGSY